MLAERASDPFDSPDHLFEVKYDGARCLVQLLEGRTELFGRSGRKYTTIFPEVAQALEINAQNAVIDGEILCLGEDGEPDFRKLQQRVHRSKALAIRLGSQAIPATFFAFDLLQLNGRDLTANGVKLPLEQRKTLLEKVLDAGPHARVVDHVVGEGVEFFGTVMQRGLEGVMGKERNGLYYPGQRHRAWLKVKGVIEDSFHILGYTWGEGWREDYFGALLLGQRDGGGFRYCGSVGTGFDTRSLEQVLGAMRPFRTDQCPFRDAPHEPKLETYLRPGVVADVKYHEVTADGKLRFPVFLRLRLEGDHEQ